jgi:hypothetical protein
MLVGVFVLPALSLITVGTAVKALGFSVLLLTGYPFALAGHYDMFRPGPRSMAYFPWQERVVMVVLVIAATAYLLVALLK